VRHHLEAWGYPAAALAALPPAPGAVLAQGQEAPQGARPLLLALGWLLYRTDALQQAFMRKHRRATVRLASGSRFRGDHR
jgi:hypothetical protein